jgi:tetratricopeptide (TPR) repeat protein
MGKTLTLPSWDQIAKAVLAFFNARTWAERKQIVEDEREMVLSDAADEVLLHLLKQYKDNEDFTRIVEEYRRLLARCRHEGIDAAFDDRLRRPMTPHEDELGALLEELSSLSRPRDMPRVLALCWAALQLVSRDHQPELWAALQGKLGDSLSDNPLGDRAQDLEQAIEHYEQALAVYTRQHFPEDWAMTQNNLANAYSNRIRGDRKRNLEQAIEHYEQTLQVYTREAFPEGWAATQNNLASAYDRAQDLEKAIEHYEQALQVYTRQDFRERWAKTQLNVGIAYQRRIPGGRAENLEQAIHHFEQALKIITPMAFPQVCRNTAYNLGNLLYKNHHFAEACATFKTAHAAVEALRGELQREGAKRALAEQNAILYARLVHCCLHEGDKGAALKYAVAGKGRAFVDLLATASFDLSEAGAEDTELAEALRQARELRQQIGSLRSQLSPNNAPSGSSSIPAAQREKMHIDLGARREEYDDLWEEMTFKYPALTATQQAPDFTAEEARKLAAELEATLVEYYRHADGWCAFVVTPEEIRHVDLPDVNGDLLKRMSQWLQWMESGTVLGPAEL